MNAVRVSIAEFKSNPTPYVRRAKSGIKVIVTKHGRDDFSIQPLLTRPSPLPIGCSEEDAVDVDEPAFPSMETGEAEPS
jgi:prevent-host-death family protein